MNIPFKPSAMAIQLYIMNTDRLLNQLIPFYSKKLWETYQSYVSQL